MFDITWVGLPVAATLMLYLLTAGHWLLPSREHATVGYQDVRQYTAEILD